MLCINNGVILVYYHQSVPSYAIMMLNLILLAGDTNAARGYQV